MPSEKLVQNDYIFALHGFLGAPEDWQDFEIVDHALPLEHEDLAFWPWSQAFNDQWSQHTSKKILMGYSLGGRLAMHALLAQPATWDAAIFISAHPGLSSESEKALRLENDQLWAKRFEQDPWEKLMHDWNANPVFAGRSFSKNRHEGQFDRQKLAKQLRNWSLGRQEHLLPHLSQVKKPILFIAGQLDAKFCTLAQDFKKFASVSIIPSAGHRVPWEQPQLFINQINQFLQENL